MKALDVENPNAAGRMTVQLIQALDNANLTPIMQQQVRADPGMVSTLRATFLKLSAAIEVAMIRLGKADNRDLVSVSQFYSHQMVTFIRTLLQVIPAVMFYLLEQVVDLQTGLEDLPTRLEKERLKELSQLDQKYEIAQLTHAVSTLTSGILAMRTTLVRFIEMDPRKLLEEGVQCELMKRVAVALDKTLTFNPKSKHTAGDLVAKIKVIGAAMEGLKKSFEYIQDYINIPGLRLWQEEVSHIVSYAVKTEAAGFLRRTTDMASQFQSAAVPIPVFLPMQGDKSRNFKGRLATEVMAVTEPTSTLYVESHGTWKPHQETRRLGLMKLLEGAVGVVGLAGFNTLLGLMAVTRGHGLGALLTQEMKSSAGWYRGSGKSCRRENLSVILGSFTTSRKGDWGKPGRSCIPRSMNSDRNSAQEDHRLQTKLFQQL